MPSTIEEVGQHVADLESAIAAVDVTKTLSTLTTLSQDLSDFWNGFITAGGHVPLLNAVNSCGAECEDSLAKHAASPLMAAPVGKPDWSKIIAMALAILQAIGPFLGA
jgi:hypothetical protein